MPLFLFDEDADLRIGFAWSSEMLERGIYVHPWHNMFLSAAMTAADIDAALNAAEGAFAAVQSTPRNPASCGEATGFSRPSSDCGARGIRVAETLRRPFGGNLRVQTA